MTRQDIADLVAGGQLEQAITAASTLLAAKGLPADERIALLEMRSTAYFERLEITPAYDDALAMVALAKRQRVPALQVPGQLALAIVQMRRGHYQEAVDAAPSGRRRRSRRPRTSRPPAGGPPP